MFTAHYHKTIDTLETIY